MPTVNNTDHTTDGFGTSPTQTLGFTGTAGRALVAVIVSGSGTVDSITDSAANTYTELFSTNSGSMKFYMTDDADGVTTVTPTFSAANTPTCMFYEVTGLAAAASQPQDTSAYASDGDGFVTGHGYEYTTSEADELVIAIVVATSSARSVTGTGGATEVLGTSTSIDGVYEIVSSAETADITWDFDTAGNGSAALVSLSPEATGGSILPLLNAYYS